METLKNKGIDLLRWSEKYTKTDMVYLFNSMGWVFLGQVLTTASALIVLVVLANLLSKETLGEYRLVVSVCLLLLVFALPGANGALPQSVAKGFSGDLKKITIARIRWGSLACFPASLMSLYYFFLGNNSLSISFFIVALAIPFFNSFFGFYPYFQGRKKFKEAAIIHAGGRVFFTIIILFVAFLLPTTPVLSGVFLLLTILTHYVGYKIALNAESKTESKPDADIIPYSKYLTIVGIPSFLAGNFDKALIGLFLGPVELALYFVATTFAIESNRIGRILAQAILPKLSEKDNIDVFKFFKKILLLEFLLILGWFVYVLIAPLLFEIFFPEYLEVISLSVVAMVAMCFAPIYVIRSFFVAQKRKSDLKIMIVYSPILQMICVTLGVLFWGILGAVVGMLLGLFFELLVGTILLLKNYRN